MIYKEEFKDLFSVPKEYYLVHCISADFAMGKGIVIKFNKLFNLKNKLKEKYPNYLSYFSKQNKNYGDCILENRVFNLITKEKYWNKPTYSSLEKSLEKMKDIIKENNISKIAMPTIGCGLDKLNWAEVSKIIQNIFKDIDIEILVCKYFN